MSKYARRVDDNQNEIVVALRACGATVRIINQGGGIPDLLVGYRGNTILIEVKDGAKVPSAQKLTEAEQEFFETWRGGTVVIINSVDKALDLLKTLL